VTFEAAKADDFARERLWPELLLRLLARHGSAGGCSPARRKVRCVAPPKHLSISSSRRGV